MAITGFEFYKIHKAIKLHFNTPYDVIKYKGATKSTIDEFNSANDKFTFVRYAKKCGNIADAIEMCVACTMASGNGWLHDDPETNYKHLAEWRKINSALAYNVGNELDSLENLIETKLSGFQSLIDKTASGNKAPLLQLYLSKKVLVATVLVIDKIHPFIDNWIKEYESDPMLKKILFQLVKYKSFLKTFALKDAMKKFGDFIVTK